MNFDSSLKPTWTIQKNTSSFQVGHNVECNGGFDTDKQKSKIIFYQKDLII